MRIAFRTPQQMGSLERSHATLKTEEVYWRLFDRPQHCRACLAEFCEHYNTRRSQWALVPDADGDRLVLHEMYAEGKTIQIPRWRK